MKNPASSCVTPAGTSNELDVQNEWEENTHTHSLEGPHEKRWERDKMGSSEDPTNLKRVKISMVLKVGECWEIRVYKRNNE